MNGIEGKVALVTGAARRRGIGRATALRLAREGADVACLDIARPYADFPRFGTGSQEELDEVVAEIRALGRRAIPLVADVSNWEQVHQAVARAGTELGPLDLVCHVAGGAAFGMGSSPLMMLKEPEWDRVVDVNLKGTFIVVRAAAEQMIANKRKGRIVTCSSQAGRRPFPLLGAYGAAKAGVVLLTQAFAQELGAHGICVNSVCPGTVDTDLLNKDRSLEKFLDVTEKGLEKWLAREIPLRRLETAEDVAGAMAFLCSEDAAYITGEALNVSGGQTMV